ncbi:MAG: 2,3-diaminopropionate biosynthesis protein SbnB [Hyphomicrobiaceae bacterium]
MAITPSFHVVPGSTVRDVINDHRAELFEAVENAYRLHQSGQSINPDSYFLRYPDQPRNRIIALPAHLGGDVHKSGIKWIASFPANTTGNLARASAVQILNDAETGYPVACLEASLISATRTAASAALAAEAMSPTPFTGSLAVIGTGIISRTTVEWLKFRNWQLEKISLYDINSEEAERFAEWLRGTYGDTVEIKRSLEEAISDASLILLATTALEPHLDDPRLLAHAPTVLHLSLRDITVNVILGSQNIVDDVEHSLKARTSVHLAEMATGNRDFIAGTLVDMLDGKCRPDPTKPRIFSPFGLGVLDIAVANHVLKEAIARGAAIAIPEFFSNAARW